MSVSGISSLSTNQIYPQYQQYQLSNSEFQQLGQDLATGNLSGAQSDFSILQQAFGQGTTTSSTASSTTSGATNTVSNPVAQTFQQLATDLKSGNLTAAQQDYSTIQQDMQSHFASHRHNHHVGMVNGGQDLLNMLNSTSQGSPNTSPLLASVAQQSYASMAQELQQYNLGSPSTAILSAVTSPVSVVA